MASLLEVIRSASPDVIQRVRDGFNPVRATGRTQKSIHTIEEMEDGNLVVTIRGHADIQGAIFGLEPGEALDEAPINVNRLEDWIFARKLDLQADFLADNIEIFGTVRKDFGFYEATEPQVRDIYDKLIASDRMDDAVFDKVDTSFKKTLGKNFNKR